jgi:hypothetical protein
VTPAPALVETSMVWLAMAVRPKKRQSPNGAIFCLDCVPKGGALIPDTTELIQRGHVSDQLIDNADMLIAGAIASFELVTSGIVRELARRLFPHFARDLEPSLLAQIPVSINGTLGPPDDVKSICGA